MKNISVVVILDFGVLVKGRYMEVILVLAFPKGLLEDQRDGEIIFQAKDEGVCLILLFAFAIA